MLALLLLIGTVAAAYAVWGLTDLFATHRYVLDVPVLVAGAVVASVALLFLTGILYKVDRLRGVAHREVSLFE